MKIYISGPITGDPEAREKFATVQEKLEAKGYEVVNPFEVGARLSRKMDLEKLSEDDRWGAYMVADLTALLSCQGIYFMPRWQMSPGANIEKIFALRLGLKEVSL